jgi:basic membrane lipoprotein Med (substrate-binding protein (PBP1-ABC) superfamily)/ABC-type branched-subunit amino acid transport system substrate-binding protein
MRSRRILLFVGLLLIVGLVAACGRGQQPTPTEAPEAPVAEATAPPAQMAEEFTCEDEIGCVDIAPGEPVRIGYALVLSGPNAQLGLDSRRGVEIAIDDHPEVLGHPVELVGEDSGCSAEGGQTAATKLASDQSLLGIVGTSCSSAGVPASKIVSDAGMVLISPSNTAPSLTAPGSHDPGYLRTAHNDKVQGAAAAEFAYNELGARTAATIHDGSPYADQLQQVFADTFEQLGGTITAQEAVNVGDTDMRPVLTSIAQDQPDFLYYPIFVAEGAFITVQAREIDGLENTTLSGADGMQAPDFVEASGEAAEGMYFSGPDLSFENEAYQDFLQAHQEKYGEAPLSVFHAHAYDATMLLLNAAEEVAVQDADGTLHIGRQALRDALYATQNYQGLTGTLTCDENGDCADPQIAVSQLQEGQYVPVWRQGIGMIAEAMAEPTEEGAAMEPSEFRVCEVTDVGGIDDKSFNATAWAGVEQAETELGVQGQYLESQEQADYARSIQEFLDQDCDLIVTVGFLLGDATAEAANANPDQKFAIVDYAYEEGAIENNNVRQLTFATQEAAFLAGYAAAAMTETGTVATFGGINIPPVTVFMDGFVWGVNYYNEQMGTDVQVLGWDPEAQEGVFTGNFESLDDGRAFAESLSDEGADVIMPVAGPVGLGSAAVAQERDLMIIGVDTDWCVSAAEFCDVVLTSVLKNMDVAVFDSVQAVLNGEFTGDVYLGTLENDGVGIASFHEFEDAVPDTLNQELDQVRQGIIDGSITLGQ